MMLHAAIHATYGWTVRRVWNDVAKDQQSPTAISV